MSADATAEMASAPIPAPTPSTASAPPPEHPQIEVANEAPNATGSPKATMGLHSPPDSNNAMKLDGSDDSELSDLDDPEPPFGEAQLPGLTEAGHDATATADAKSEAQEDEDIGEVLPDHWSGSVPVFKPDMYQFKDFKKFVCWPSHNCSPGHYH